MRGVSGFTFVHNALDSGYPIVEAIEAVAPWVNEMVVVDMQSTDGTSEFLKTMNHVDVISGWWEPGQAGACLKKNHALHRTCNHEIVWHFEADEVHDSRLVQHVLGLINSGEDHIAVPRIQIEQNFQRIRWNWTYVHRVFRRGSVHKDGESTVSHKRKALPIHEVRAGHGFLWDVTQCFRDHVIRRLEKQRELWGQTGESVWTRLAPLHNHFPPVSYTLETLEAYLLEPHWTYSESPFKLPSSLARWVGKTVYAPHISHKEDFRFER